jgi:carnitine O-acetyltransferase
LEYVVLQDEHRAALFRKAVSRHLQYAAWAADGRGVDRHLFGLKKVMHKDEPVPEIYTDPAFGKTNHWELSTSQLSSSFFDGWGYGEGALCFTRLSYYSMLIINYNAVVPDGYGLSYSIGDNYIRWTITSLKRNTAQLKHYLAEAATETRMMMERARATEVKKDNDSKAKL